MPSKLDYDYSPLGRGPSFALLLLVLFAISSSLTILVHIVGTDGATPKAECHCAVTAPKLCPSVPVQPTPDTHELKFSGGAEWQGWDAEVTEKWRGMLPANNGLGQDDDYNDGIPYGIAMFHQLHCLHAIRAHYTALLSEQASDAESAAFARTASQKGHIGHCFNWVRQALLCHADSTRELQVYTPAGQLIDNTTRTCGNIQVLYAETKNPKAVKAGIDATAPKIS